MLCNPHAGIRRTGLSKRLSHITATATEDPFLGSGTTLVAAEQTKRVVCGLELDPKYVDVVVERWQKFTREKACLESTGEPFEAVATARMRKVA